MELKFDPESLKLLMDPLNRAILNLCAEKPRRPTELAETLRRTRPAIDKRAKQLRGKNLLSGYFDEKGRKFYVTTEKGRRCLENYPIMEKPELSIKKPISWKPIAKLIRPSTLAAAFFMVIALGGYITFTYFQGSPERGVIVLAFWATVAVAAHLILRRFEKRM